jgi:hypothetical protein
MYVIDIVVYFRKPPIALWCDSHCNDLACMTWMPAENQAPKSFLQSTHEPGSLSITGNM